MHLWLLLLCLRLTLHVALGATAGACACMPFEYPRCRDAQVRLLMCYSATHLEKLDATRQQQWQKVARLNGEDMACVTNLEYLGVPGEGQGVGGKRHAPAAASVL
mgnify:CR=1 FL=1